MRRASAPHYAEALAAGGGAWKWDEAVARPLDVSDVGTGEACQQVCLEVPLPAGEGPNGRAQAANTPVDLLLPLAGLDCGKRRARHRNGSGEAAARHDGQLRAHVQKSNQYSNIVI